MAQQQEPMPGWYRELGGTGLVVSAVTAGTSAVGRGTATGEDPDSGPRDVATIRAVLDSPITTIDTSNGYADGWSERRIGEALRAAGGLGPGQLVISKVDPRGRDFSGDRVRASLEESLERLSLDRLPLVHLHDPDHFEFGEVTGKGGALEALLAMREEGTIESLGLAGGRVAEITRYLELGVFDALLVHNRWTLVDRSAGALVAAAAERGMGIMNAAVYGGGLLAGAPGERSTYAYRPAPEALLRAIEAMREVCIAHDTDLATAALQFSVRDERVHTTVVGMSRPERVEVTVEAATSQLPEALWPELEALVPPEELWIESRLG
ncbi:aldo/keto reductase [Actinotalea sp. C106]|uniref:aldo/keto reductase n=1 Tax=Actinotalea sp. C106 TaxID=2908644 RepID=UPI002028DE5A|nr:aldo/keto reductase [Actinotalea sp. C106]